MFFILSKILYFLIGPFTWLIIALYFAFFSKKPIRAKRGKYFAIGILLFFSNTFIYKEVCRQWEVFGTPISKVGKYDVAIVLGGMTEYNNDLKELSLRRGGDRIWQAISLYKTKHVKKILISGDHGYLIDRGMHEADQLKAVLVKWGIPEKDILTESVSKNTYENAQETKKILQQQLPKAKRFLLVTSGRHMRRSLACFEHAGIQCQPFSTDLYTGPKRFYTFEDYILPNVSVMDDWHGLIKEMIGYVAYAITRKI
ncbi:MAG: YdcF family protein [Fluviicola sp.]|nr:YdcF family protein [Fluviicola sp.]